MDARIQKDIESLVLPSKESHKGQNGRLLIIGGSHLFHASTLWALEVASRIVDLVHYASTPENNALVTSAKQQFRNGIVIDRKDIDAYIAEDDCILIGPGMTRDGETEALTHALLSSYPEKQWVIDAGALQMIRLSDIPKGAVLTPHQKEFEGLWEKASREGMRRAQDHMSDEERVRDFARVFDCTVLLKGSVDIVCSADDSRHIEGGNEGLTKGGTGDVLAGLVAALSCRSTPFSAAVVASYVVKKTADELHQTVGPFFNASDVAARVPQILFRIVSSS